MNEVKSVGKSKNLPPARYYFDTEMPEISEQFKIFYYIRNVNPEECKEKFSIAENNCIITLESELNRLEYEYVILTIVASKHISDSIYDADESTLKVTVVVSKKIINTCDATMYVFTGS